MRSGATIKTDNKSGLTAEFHSALSLRSTREVSPSSTVLTTPLSSQ